jgi:D-sedoheptulose 7-phosphate isomerase/D-glycero-D-manno-heptose 1,7-bisphosphate phosphatase
MSQLATSVPARSGVLLDRDGTIIVDHGYVGSVDRVDLIPGAASAIATLNAAGLPVAVVTNQAGVARGYYRLDDVTAVHRYIDDELAREGAHIDLWLSCPYHPDGVVDPFARASQDRKPAPGMALAAAAALGLDLSMSWVVGDRPEDMGLAAAVGATPIRVGATQAGPTLTVSDLAAAVRVILDPAGHGRRSRGRFPDHAYPHAGVYGRDYAATLTTAMASVDEAALDQAAKVLQAAHQRDAVIFACGNGGSAAIANHLQCDHVKGVGNGTNLRTRVVSLSSHMELFSAVANDIGYEAVFEYQLKSMARPGDVLVVISSSGRSPNIVRALEWAAANDVASVALTGFDGEPARGLATVGVHVESNNYGVIEDAHQACMHLLAQFLRQAALAPEAVAGTVF